MGGNRTWKLLSVASAARHTWVRRQEGLKWIFETREELVLFGFTIFYCHNSTQVLFKFSLDLAWTLQSTVQIGAMLELNHKAEMLRGTVEKLPSLQVDTNLEISFPGFLKTWVTVDRYTVLNCKVKVYQLRKRN